MISSQDRETVLGFAKMGHPPKEIVQMMGGAVVAHQVYAIFAWARRSGITLPRFSGGYGVGVRHSVRIEFPSDICDRLKISAEIRGVDVKGLIRRIVKEAVDGGLIEAILDDRVPSASGESVINRKP